MKRYLWLSVCERARRWAMHSRTPWWVRCWIVRWSAKPASEVMPYLYTVGEFRALADALDQVPVGATVHIPGYFIAQTVKLPSGDNTLLALSRFFATQRPAEREHARLLRKHPLCTLLCLLLAFDPQNPKHVAEMANIRRRAILDDAR